MLKISAKMKPNLRDMSIGHAAVTSNHGDGLAGSMDHDGQDRGQPSNAAETQGSGAGGKQPTAEQLEDERRLKHILGKMEHKQEQKVLRIKYANMLWPTDARYKEFTSQSGRDGKEEKQYHVSHLLNTKEFKTQWDAYLAMEAHTSSAPLRRCRETAIKVSMTKEKRKELEAKKAKEAKGKKEKEAKPSGSTGSKGRSNAANPKPTSSTKGKSSSGSGKSSDPSTRRNERPGSESRSESGRKPAPPKPQQQQQQQQSQVEARAGTKRPLSTSSAASSVPPSRHSRHKSPSSVKERLGTKPTPEEQEEGEVIDVHIHDDELFKDEDDNNTAFAAQAKPVGEWRVVVTPEEGSFNKALWDKFRDRFTAAVSLQQDDLAQVPMLIKEFWFHGGRVVVEPANQYSQNHVLTIVNDQLEISSKKFKAVKATDLPPTATLVFRIEASGKVDDLLTCPRRGVGRLNGWPAETAGGIRLLQPTKHHQQQHGPRYVRAACTEPVVAAIKKTQGVIYCGAMQATVQWKKLALRDQLEVTFTHQ